MATADDEVDAWNGPEHLPAEFFRFGVAFADGRATSNRPPPAPVTIACAWPAGGLAESQLTLDRRELGLYE